jgi:apolipoprotein D and lipocalin family protein
MIRCALVLGTLLLGAPMLSACVAAPDASTPQPVAAVDVQRYLGAWHEVARLPMWAQDSSSVSCEDTVATIPCGRTGGSAC